ncbi:hypothetical protein [Iodidimonas sp. SYSU 1G8]|uniref:hypothetical protein n=1 Tax=Iodidimonas sp. SYSU 1G8 TaxID=3133967 RepID=UPI0031FEC8C5
MEPTNKTDRFCSDCGLSLIPLPSPHISKNCETCNRQIFFTRINKDGIKVEKGERLTIPSGFIRLSLDPSDGGKLFRPGLSFLIKKMFLSGHPKNGEELDGFLRLVTEDTDNHLSNLPELSGLDLKIEEDANKAFKILEDKSNSSYYRVVQASFAEIVKKFVGASDATNAAWAGYMLGTFRGLSLVSEPLFEQTLWRGYLANQIVYEAAAAAAQTPAEAEAIKKLEPLFRRLDEATLFIWIESNLPIGPRLGVKSLPEEVLRSLAKWHLASYQREREGIARTAVEKRAERELKIKWISAGVAVTTCVFGALKAVGLF